MNPFSPRYLSYLASSAWQIRRRQALDRAGHRCQMCGESRRLQVHHNTYAHLGHEEDQDLIVLCWYCHTVETWALRLRRWWRRLGAGERFLVVFSLVIALPVFVDYFGAWLLSFLR